MAQIKTAEEHLKDLRHHEGREKRLEAQRQKIKEQNRLERDRLEFYEDIRDDVMSAVKNSGMSFEDIHGRCGPCPHTLENWSQKKVRKPQLGKMRAVLHILGLDFAIVARHANGN